MINVILIVYELHTVKMNECLIVCTIRSLTESKVSKQIKCLEMNKEYSEHVERTRACPKSRSRHDM